LVKQLPLQGVNAECFAGRQTAYKYSAGGRGNGKIFVCRVGIFAHASNPNRFTSGKSAASGL